MEGYLPRVIFFTLCQAGLSAFISLLIAIPVTRALMRQGDSILGYILLRLFALPIMIPAIAAIFGIIAIFGINGLFANFAGKAHLPWFNLYGLEGILLAHVFLNFPLAVRLLLAGYQNVPFETWRLAASLDLKPVHYWRYIDWPLLRQQLPMIGALIFLLCLTSFSIVLTLGGGPRYTTLEVAIFQSLRFEFNPNLAFDLALAQICIAVFILLLAGRLSHFTLTSPKLRHIVQRWDGKGALGRVLDHMLLLAGGLFIALPISSSLFSGMAHITSLIDEKLYPALLRSLLYAFIGGGLCAMSAWLLSSLFFRASSHWTRFYLSAIGFASLILSPVMVGGFVLILTAGAEFSLISLYFLVILLYVFLGLPFALYAFWPAYKKVRVDYDRLCASLPLSRWRRFAKIELPLLLPSAKKAGLYAALAILGDFGLVAILGDRRAFNLPWYLYDQLGSYRSGPAAATSLFMLLMAFLLVHFAERKSS